jgi:CheY-like chemotaxis protein
MSQLDILIVDDDYLISTLHTMHLKRAGVQNNLISKHNGKETLDYIDEHANGSGSRFLVLLDINMPVMNGWEFLDQLQERDYADGVYVVMVSSSVDASDIRKSKEYPQVIDYIEKPLTNVQIDQLKQLDPLKELMKMKPD